MVSDGYVELGGLRLVLGAPGRGITRWGIAGIGETDAIDGLPTTVSPHRRDQARAEHPNGATGIDHVVILTPNFDRTAQALAEVNLTLRRIRDAGGFRQGFRRLGPAILELVENPRADDANRPATFWGLVVIVTDLRALADRLGDLLGPIKPAVQPGRDIATLRPGAGVGEAVAFMTPES